MGNQEIRILKYFVFYVSFLIFLSGCATIYNPATEKQEIILISTPMEVSLGKGVASKIEKESTIIKDPEIAERVNAIGQKVAKVSDRTDIQYHFAVIKDKEVNAFTTPGGYIFVNSGLLEKTTDDELACVLGHEIGHVAARHVAKKLQAQLGYDILLNIALSQANIKNYQQAISITYNLISLGYSREDELLSDRLGAKYAYKSGYDPYAMVTFLKKLKELDKSDMGPVFLRSHPYASQRIQMMEKEIPVIISKVTSTNNPAQNIADKNKAKISRVMCPKCRRIFDSSTKYCPYDGVLLK